MSVLATDKKLISFGTDYSAGSGISIIDHTISIIPSAVGKTYSAGPNIDIYDVSGQPTISSKDWSSDIEKASANSLTQSTSLFNNWVNGQYTGDIANITNNITALSGDLSSYYKKTETSSKEQINDALQYVSAHAVGDVEVNNYVHNNSATIDEVNSAYKANSASYITAHQSLEGYATESWVNAQGYLTGVNIPESATWNETSNVVSINSAQWSEGKTYEGISPIVVNNAEDKISADTWVLSAGDGVSFTDDSANKVTRIDVTAQGGNYIPYTAVNTGTFPNFKTNSGLEIITLKNGILNSTYISPSTIQIRYLYSTTGISPIKWGAVLSNSELTFDNKSDSAYVDMEKIHTWDSASNYIQTISSTYYPKSNPSSFATESWVNGQGFLTAHQDISNKLDSSAFSSVSGDFLTTSFSIPESAVWNETSNVVQSNSAQWAEGGGGAISSYTSAWSDDVQPYGDFVINTLNEKYISSLISNSSNSAKFAYNSNSANSANYAETVNETYLENKGFARNLSSEYGTVSIIHKNIIESTNSAISRVGNEGFVSSYGGEPSVGDSKPATYTWDKVLQNTTITLDMGWSEGETLTYSANTDLTGEIVLPTGTSTQSIGIPNATEIKVWTSNWLSIENAVVSAADSFETVVGELAWASAIPTFEYDSTNKISAINGSAIAGGGVSGEFVPQSAFDELKQSYDALSSLFATYSGQWLLPNEGV